MTLLARCSIYTPSLHSFLFFFFSAPPLHVSRSPAIVIITIRHHPTSDYSHALFVLFVLLLLLVLLVSRICVWLGFLDYAFAPPVHRAHMLPVPHPCPATHTPFHHIPHSFLAILPPSTYLHLHPSPTLLPTLMIRALGFPSPHTDSNRREKQTTPPNTERTQPPNTERTDRHRHRFKRNVPGCSVPHCTRYDRKSGRVIVRVHLTQQYSAEPYLYLCFVLGLFSSGWCESMRRCV